MNITRKPRILVTGGAGYIGSVLVRQLIADGFQVRVLDILRSGGESLIAMVGDPNFEFIQADVRDVKAVRKAMSGCFGVAHMAAIVGDPASRNEPGLTKSVNIDGSHTVWEAAVGAGCERFVFASTCSNYGKVADSSSYATEESPLKPLSIYAATKVEFEQFLLKQSCVTSCAATCLRFSTVYGLSPRIRFDLTVNEFTRDLVLGKELVVFGQQFWRPYCHVVDLARSVVMVFQANRSKVAYDVFNVGDTAENYTKQMIVDEIQKQVSTGRVKYINKEEDPRDYRVSFEKIRERLGFRVSRRLADGVTEFRIALESKMISNPYDPRYSNV